jgi:hypothetical protein
MSPPQVQYSSNLFHKFEVLPIISARGINAHAAYLRNFVTFMRVGEIGRVETTTNLQPLFPSLSNDPNRNVHMLLNFNFCITYMYIHNCVYTIFKIWYITISLSYFLLCAVHLMQGFVYEKMLHGN